MRLRISPRPLRSNPESEGKPRTRFTMAWIRQILYILYSLEAGVFLVFLPWLGIWDNNYLLYLYPEVRSILANSFLKGAVLGLGIVNILIGIQEIVLFKRNCRDCFSK